MEHVPRSDLSSKMMQGRAIQTAIGMEAFSSSENMTVGFAHFSAEHGPMDPHCHSEEGIYVIDAVHGWLEWGPAKNQLHDRLDLAPGMILHVPENEWHVFRYGEGGYVDIVFIYAPPIW